MISHLFMEENFFYDYRKDIENVKNENDLEQKEILAIHLFDLVGPEIELLEKFNKKNKYYQALLNGNSTQSIEYIFHRKEFFDTKYRIEELEDSLNDLRSIIADCEINQEYIRNQEQELDVEKNSRLGRFMGLETNESFPLLPQHLYVPINLVYNTVKKTVTKLSQTIMKTKIGISYRKQNYNIEPKPWFEEIIEKKMNDDS